MGSGITYNKETFNTEPLLNELNEIIKKRLEEMFQEFLFKYRLFEENYNAVLNLPALKYNIGTYKQFNVKKVNSNKKRKTSSKNISIIKKLLEKNKLLQEEINKLKGVNIIDLTTDVESDDNTSVQEVVIKEEHIPVRLEKENIRLNIEEDSIVEDSNDNICSDCECRVILDSDITIVDGKNYCGGCVPESDADEDNESDASLEEEADASLEEEADASLEEEDSVAGLEEESVASLEEDSVAGLEEESDASLEEEEDSVAGLEEDDLDTEASDEESVDESSNDLANNEEQASVEANVVASVEESVEEDEELFEIEIDDETYCTNNEVNGFIYVLDKDGDVGEKVGYFKDSEPIFYNEEN
jgi:hypothetical protein